jgi:DNA-binding NtrC family response regulator
MTSDLHAVPGPAPGPAGPGPALPRPVEAAALLWQELRQYRRRREAWDRELERLLAARRDLEARHRVLVLHAVEVAASAEPRGADPSALPAPGEGPDFEERMALFERALLEAGLARTGGCRRKAAALLGLLPTTLCEKLKRLGMARTAH